MRPDWIFGNYFPHIEGSDCNSLDQHVNNYEIREALFTMGALKAPCIDVFNALFYHNQWSVIENSLCSMVRDVFE